MVLPLFTAVTPSVRQLLVLLRCISFSKKAQVRIMAEGLRFSCEEGSVMEAFVFLEKSLFTVYGYNAQPPSASEGNAEIPLFEISLVALLETLNIFSLSDPASSKRLGGDQDAFAAHRLNRHAAIDAFRARTVGGIGTCAITYAGEGGALDVHMAEAGVTTTCELTTYEAETREDIPFDRESLSVKTIMRASALLDAINELAAMNPSEVTIYVSPESERGPELAFSAKGALGSTTVDFTTKAHSDTPLLETFHCPERTSASFSFLTFKAALRAMATATKVSIRLDTNGVLSMQFLVELALGPNAPDAVAFVDFRAVPLVEEDEDEDGDSDSPGDS